MKKVMYIILILILIIIVGSLGFLYYRGMVLSEEILHLEISGPTTAKVGDEVKYVVKYKNNGNFALEKPKVSFELPDNSINEDGKIRFEKELQNIEPGTEGSISFKSILIGKESDEKNAKASLSYTPHNLSVRYESDAILITKIQEVPIDLDFDLPSSIEYGKEMSLSLSYLSNIDYPLENLSIKVDPMADFTITSSSPSSLDKVEWKIGTLNKGNGGKIRMNGTVSSDPQDHITFSAHLGMWQQGNFIIIKEVSQDVEVRQPALLISETINGSSSYQPSYGETLYYDIYLKNTGNSSFSNLFLISRLDGSAFDLSTLKSSFGQFNLMNNSIVFDPKQTLDLKNLDPGEEIKLSFSVKLRDVLQDGPSNLENVIKNTVNILSFSKEFTYTIK